MQTSQDGGGGVPLLCMRLGDPLLERSIVQVDGKLYATEVSIFVYGGVEMNLEAGATSR